VHADDVRNQFAYDRWANARLLDAATRLTPEEYVRDLGASFASVRGTLIHIIRGEKVWLHRWVTGSRMPEVAPGDLPDCASLQEAFSQWSTERRVFAEDLTDERLQSTMNIRDQDFTLADLIRHVTNHSTYHRGQVVLLLRQLGHTPPSTDYALFVLESGSSAP
jgi:uncharacterized damage-inducible protein DinB